MPTFTTVNPVAVKQATKAEQYDVVFDNTQALQQGTVALLQVKLDGLVADPSVSPAGDAVIAYRSDIDQVIVSRDGGAYQELGAPFRPADPIAITMGL